eukprot:568702-Prymnesium_polylepis.1
MEAVDCHARGPVEAGVGARAVCRPKHAVLARDRGDDLGPGFDFADRVGIGLRHVQRRVIGCDRYPRWAVEGGCSTSAIGDCLRARARKDPDCER